MTFKRAIPKPTDEQQARQDRARELGCVACAIEWDLCGHNPVYCDAPPGAPEIHHLTRTGRQIGQDETVCLCSWHHRGICVANYDSRDMRDLFGPSMAKGSKPFHARYGSNEELLAYQNNLLERGT